ncbi:MAG: SWIM zinc finger family protein [Solobacterium sp.]|jgi:uncharacterized Zn finger protein|nr:SWIM zinc finger family protein [Solobacterium sp.]MCH4048426.1 SWIM zinc finger family protein [Solobacterium sp.]MCH4074722.1 SWIM zinc finger family protein [Solobacterium sp.]MCI1313903.1 SWIM zinc finger family protein [Solobacterium sp.]MCI1346436.1 SWIM zinc finger family protein [Solobacterium sp.]
MAKYYETKYYSQPTAEELKARAAESERKARRKGVVYHPVVVKGRKICTSWWGTAWCENLERYADYENRIERGKRYVRNGSVIDLQIEKGKVHARVQGSRRTPYKVEIRISPLSEEKCQTILDRCGRKLDDLETLLSGEFPDDMKELFFEKNGLFPSPAEISLSCSCPDYAIMCKHVAAALYGVGTRFDEDPMLFFELRGVEVGRFIDVSLKDHVDTLLEHADNRTSRMMDDADIEKVFGSI